MAHKAVQQCLLGVNWGELDYLIVDLPPGTGDVHLTLVQTVPSPAASSSRPLRTSGFRSR